MGTPYLLLLTLTSWLLQQSKTPILSVGPLFSQLSQQQIAEDIERRYLQPLLQQAGLDLRKVDVQKLSDIGFANNVFRILSHDNNNVMVAKVFSDLAKKRLNPNQAFMGEIDEILHHHGIGPTVVAHTSDALLMEYIEGQVLTENMLFKEAQGISICQAVGQKLGHMHSLEGKGGPNNMLWHALEVLLSSIDPQFEMKAESGESWTRNKLEDTIGECRIRLESLEAPCVQMGHGDFKLSNVMITNTNEIRFIDFELTGRHYRGYDLAKFFRSSKESIHHPVRRQHQLAFWESYQQQVTELTGESTNVGVESISQLEWEAELLEPMTWLEAASFFLSMANVDDPSQKDKWNGMALDRLVSFERMKQRTD